MYIYIPLCRYWIVLYRYVLVFIVPHVNIELEDNKQFISNIPRINLLIKYSVQQLIDLNGNVIGNKCCHCNEGSLYSIEVPIPEKGLFFVSKFFPYSKAIFRGLGAQEENRKSQKLFPWSKILQ